MTWQATEETHELLGLASVLDFNSGVTVRLLHNLEGPLRRSETRLTWQRLPVDSPVGSIGLDLLVIRLTTNETLESEDGVGRVDDGLALGGETDETLAVLGESDDGRRCPCTLGVLDDSGSFALHDSDAGVCCTQVNTDNGAVDF